MERITEGRGSMTMEFDHYEVVPQNGLPRGHDRPSEGGRVVLGLRTDIIAVRK